MSREIKAPPAKVEISKSLDGKHTLAFSEASHRYKLNGKPAVGVTTFLKGGLPTSQGLIHWQKGQALNYMWGQMTNPAGEGAYGAYGTYTEDQRVTLFKEAQAADRTVSQEAADVGTILHSYAELHSRGSFIECGDLQLKAKTLEAWPKIEACILKYLAWCDSNNGTLVSAEGLVASPEHLYCGKFDLLSKRNGKLILSDYKTSKSIYLDQYVQLAAYAVAIKEWLNLDVEGLEVLRFGKDDGEFETLLVDKPEEIRDFKAQAIRSRETFGFIKTGNADFRWSYKK